jgi:hypothetical protein
MKCLIFILPFVASSALAQVSKDALIKAWVTARFEKPCPVEGMMSDHFLGITGGTLSIRLRHIIAESCPKASANEFSAECLQAMDEVFMPVFEKVAIGCSPKENSAQAAVSETIVTDYNHSPIGVDCSPVQFQWKLSNSETFRANAKPEMTVSEVESLKIKNGLCVAEVSCDKATEFRGKAVPAGDYYLYCTPTCEGSSQCTDQVNNCRERWPQDICEHAWIQKDGVGRFFDGPIEKVKGAATLDWGGIPKMPATGSKRTQTK